MLSQELTPLTLQPATPQTERHKIQEIKKPQLAFLVQLALRRQRQKDHYKFTASLLYKAKFQDSQGDREANIVCISC